MMSNTIRCGKPSPEIFLFLVIVLFWLPFNMLDAQTDKEFWFVAPEVTYDHDPPGGQPIYLTFTTTDLPANVVIEMPANAALFTPILLNIPAFSTFRYDLTSRLAEVENKYDNIDGIGGKGKRGIHITSDNLITCYYESTSKNGNNPDIYALKGNNALGTSFYTTFQTRMYNVNGALNATYDSVTFANRPITWANNPTNGYNIYSSASNTVTAQKTNTGVVRSAEASLGGVQKNEKIIVTISNYTLTSGTAPRLRVVSNLTTRTAISNAVQLSAATTSYTLTVNTTSATAFLEVYHNSNELSNFTFRATCRSTITAYNRDGWNNPAYSAFDVVFTEDNTYLTLDIPAGKGIYNAPPTPHTGKVTIGPFKRGETYTGTPAMITPPEVNPPFPAWKKSDKYFGRSATDHLAGVKVTTNGKKIAITLKDDSMKALVGGCYDLAGDQTIPIELTGTEYIVLKGRGSTGNLVNWYYPGWITNPVSQEAIFVLATQNNTEIFINGASKGFINAGETYVWQVVDNITLVKSSAGKPVYCLQISGWGCEMGEAVLPTTSVCTGSTQVGFTRSTSEQFFLNVMVRKKAKGGFKLNGAYNSLLDSTKFVDIPGSEWAAALIGDPANGISTAIIPVGVASRISNSIDVFHVGVINGSASGGTRFGYFSDYNPLTVSSFITESGSENIRLCYGESAQIVARGGIFYSWNPTTYLSDPMSAFPVATPPATISYVATVSGACDQFDSTVINISVAPPFRLDFNVDTTFGCAPLDVKIHDKSSHVRKYFWNYGDGSPAVSYITNKTTNDTVISHRYENKTRPVKTYNLRLIVENLYQCRDTVYRPIIVFPEVSAGFTVTPDTSCHPLEAVFTNSSVNADFYQWDFGDGGSSVDTVPFHSFRNFTNSIQNYQTRLIAKSQYQCADTAYKKVLVHPFLKADFAVPYSQGCAPFKIRISNNCQGGAGIKSYLWDFGDGNTSTSGASVLEHTYQNTSNAPITYNLRLIIGNGQGCFDTLTRQIRVLPDVHSAFTVSDTLGCHPLGSQFTSPANNVPVTYTWDFGDGSSSSDANPFHLFSNVSPRGADTTFKVRLIVTSNEYCTDTSFRNIKIYPVIDAKFTVDKGQGCAPLTVAIANNSVGKYPGISSYGWTFGDGQSATSSNSGLTHVYNNTSSFAVNYPLQLVVKNTGGCADTLRQIITVYPQITAIIDPSVSEGCNPLKVDFVNGSNMPAAQDFVWNMGDGVSSTEMNLSHTFSHLLSKDTTFRVQLIAKSIYQCADTAEWDIKVFSYIEAGFAVKQTSGCSPLPLEITNGSRGGITQYFWDFRDGNTSPQMLPNHTYGNKTLTDIKRNLRLVVRNSHACADTAEKEITIFPEVKAAFGADQTQGCQPLLVNLTNTSNTPVASNFYWTFGNKGSSNQIAPSFVFQNLGNADSTHVIRLFATSSHGCSDDTTLSVTAFANIEADFKITNPEICSDYSIEFQNVSRGGISTYSWDLDGNGSQDSNTPASSFSRVYTNTNPEPRNIPVRLVVKNQHNCFDTLIKPVTIYPRITADFSYDSTGCHPFQVQFTNKSLNGSFLFGSAGNYDWSFGDGGTSGELNPSKLFLNYGSTDIIRKVKLVAYSPYLCKDSVEKNVHVYHKPKAKFSVDKTVACPPFNINITNESVASNEFYIWNFGDQSGIRMESNAPLNHVYLNNTGEIRDYTLSLHAETNRGCSDDISMIVSVYPQVKAAFSYDSSGCSPFTSAFVNRSENARFYHWDFGDGKLSILPNPSNRYVNTGSEDKTYIIRLVSRSMYECTDTTSHQVTVFGQPMAEFTPDPLIQIFEPYPSVSFTNFSNNQADWKYFWDFGNGETSENSDPLFSHTYRAWGSNKNNNTFTITLRAWNNLHTQCADTVQHDIRILPPEPEIDIKNFDPEGCEPFRVPFTISYAYAYEDSFYWDFDDGTFSTEKEPVHIFQKYGVYRVKLTITGDGGQNYAYKTIKVFQTPVANFDISPRVALLPDEKVKAFNKSQLAQSYIWDFGDGNTSSEKDPEHLYNKLGKYTIKLQVWSENGCTDSITKPQVVSIEGVGSIEFPNAFTPNLNGPSDGKYQGLSGELLNDIFYPKHEGVKEYHLEIYTRWGEKLFETDDVWTGWDGYFNNQLCKQDVYVWKARGKFWNGLEFLKAGDVTLLHKQE